MSGGSFSYLCFKDKHDLFEYSTVETLDAMVSRLNELGYGDAARETLELKLIILQAIVRADMIRERMTGVWKAVEWYDSSDSGIDAVNKAIEKYRT